MRVDFTAFGVEPPEQGKTGRAGQQVGNAGSGASNSVGSASGADQASLSVDYTRVQSLEAQVLAQPEMRADKIQSLQQTIGNGNYSVAASQVADAMVSELSGTQG
ncbi:MAG: flagellar biosynthesis anti-sigma factor FlgM [Terriglobales bacterium]